jgi:hypothetical protein
MEHEQGRPLRVKIISAGDEYSLEEKLNEFLQSLLPTERLVDMKLLQVEYHNRTGGTDSALLANLIIQG